MYKAILINERLCKQMLVSVFLFFVCGIFANQFIVPGPQKTQSKGGRAPSKSKMQEKCCQEIVGILRELPLLLKGVADMQQEGMKQVCGFVEGNDACMLKQANVHKLQQMHAELVAIAGSIKSMHQKCDQYAHKMRLLH